MEFEFSNVNAVVTKTEQHTETKISGGGGEIKGDWSYVHGTIAGIESKTSYLTDFWVKYENGKEQNFRAYNMIPIKEGTKLRFYIAGKSGQTIAVKNIGNGQLYYFTDISRLATSEGVRLPRFGGQKIALVALSVIVVLLGFIVMAPFILHYVKQSGFTLTYPSDLLSSVSLNTGLTLIIGILVWIYGFKKIKMTQPKRLTYFTFYFLVPTVSCCFWLFSLQPTTWLLSPILLLGTVFYLAFKVNGKIGSFVYEKIREAQSVYESAWSEYHSRH